MPLLKIITSAHAVRVINILEGKGFKFGQGKRLLCGIECLSYRIYMLP